MWMDANLRLRDRAAGGSLPDVRERGGDRASCSSIKCSRARISPLGSPSGRMLAKIARIALFRAGQSEGHLSGLSLSDGDAELVFR